MLLSKDSLSRIIVNAFAGKYFAVVTELEDEADLNPAVRKGVQVRILPAAPSLHESTSGKLAVCKTAIRRVRFPLRAPIFSSVLSDCSMLPGRTRISLSAPHKRGRPLGRYSKR